MGKKVKEEYSSGLDAKVYLLKGGIRDFLNENSYSEFRKELRHLIIVSTSQVFVESAERDVEKLVGILDKVTLLVKGAHFFLHHKKRLKIEDKLIDVKWIKNPYRCIKKYRSLDDKRFNTFVAHYDEVFISISRKEAQNFTRAFEDIFNKRDISTWLNLIDDWKSCIMGSECLPEYGSDSAPLVTFEKLVKLHEACVICNAWANNSYPPPNRHLVEEYLNIEYDSYQYANPVRMLQFCFSEFEYSKMEAIINNVYQIGQVDPNFIIGNPKRAFQVIKELIKIGWLFLQTDYFPDDWLKPNSFNFIQCPVYENEEYTWAPKYLNPKESVNVRKTLSKLFYKTNLFKEIEIFETHFIAYINNDIDEKPIDINLESRDRILKIIEVETLIVLSFIQRSTILGIAYYPRTPASEISELNERIIQSDI